MLPVLPDQPDMNSLTLQAFCNDVARQIHTPGELARRYGFASPRAARDWIDKRPPVHQMIKTIRAIWESEDNVENRIRAYAHHALLEAAPSNAQIMLDPSIHPTVRIDAMKETAKIAGLTGAPGLVRNKDGTISAPGAAPFAVNIIFQNAGHTESFTAARQDKEPVEIEGEAV